LAPEGCGGPQATEKPIAAEDDVDRRAASLTTRQVLGDPVQLVVTECTGGELAQSRGVRVILGVHGQDISLRGPPMRPLERAKVGLYMHEVLSRSTPLYPPFGRGEECKLPPSSEVCDPFNGIGIKRPTQESAQTAVT